MRRLRARIGAVVAVTITSIGACKFTAPNVAEDAPVGTDDAPELLDAYVPDAGACSQVGKECVGPTLRDCQAVDVPPVDTPCVWGCSSTGEAHCAKLVPSGGALLPEDLDQGEADLQDKTLILVNTRIDTDTGEISLVRAAGTGVISNIEYFQRGNVGVFRFKKLALDGNRLEIRGSRALAIVAIDGLTINARLDATGDCAGGTPGPGGFPGGAAEANGSGSGSGEGGTAGGNGGNFAASGGGGGGHGGSGGDGGSAGGESATSGGSTYGDALISVLAGGGGGGGGGGSGGSGGGGGGAVQLVSNGTIRVALLGVEAGGCGGRGTNDNRHGGGGGGAGGAILIEAPTVDVAQNALLTVNGGGGGGADTNVDNNGEDGLFSGTQAEGGKSGDQGGDGGSGAAGSTLSGEEGESSKFAGGGGGGVGRIRINTYILETAQISPNAVISPPFDAPGTTATRGVANVQ